VDVYLTSFAGGSTKLALSDVGYGAVSDYSRLAPGQYTRNAACRSGSVDAGGVQLDAGCQTR
jgi:hypothetical protein